MGGEPPFKHVPNAPSDGLKQFERLTVNTQSCRDPAMRWLVAMHEGLFPFVRDCCRSRLLFVHIGATQQGKTTAAQRFTVLLGLGQVKGDYSVAAFANQPDIGLLVMDNKEQWNFEQPLIDFCLFLATGAQHGRSTADGKLRPQATSRPVGVITSIEGVFRSELQARCVEVGHEIHGTRVDRDNIEDEILKHRDAILSAMTPVFQEWLRLRGTQQFWNECPRPAFERHLITLAELLSAYARIAEKPDGWAEQIIAGWSRQLSKCTADAEAADDLEFPIKSVLTAYNTDISVSIVEILFDGNPGKLYVTETDALLAMLRRNFTRDLALPKNATGLGRRLRSARFRELRFLEEESAPQLAQLKRTAYRRPIGFFIADEQSGERGNDSSDRP